MVEYSLGGSGCCAKLASEAKVKGKALTPFLLGELARRTGGKSLRANLALLAHNAQFAAMLAHIDTGDLKS